MLEPKCSRITLLENSDGFIYQVVIDMIYQFVNIKLQINRNPGRALQTEVLFLVKLKTLT
jgi:hypothetical protein